MYKYFTAHETRRLKIYKIIKMTPNEASKMENSPVVWYNIYGAYLSLKYLTDLTNSKQARLLEFQNIKAHSTKVICQRSFSR